MNFDLMAALDKLEASKPELVVVGDLILDEYVIGYPERISREAPVLILEHKETFYRLGGAANAALNAAKLGARVTLVGFLGEDFAGEQVASICAQAGIELITCKPNGYQTALKTRILANNQSQSLSYSGTNSAQQVLRVDRLPALSSLSQEVRLELANLIDPKKTLLFSAYGLGVCERELVQAALVARPERIVIADPSNDFAVFAGAQHFTPNQPDTEKALGRQIDFSSSEDLQKTWAELRGLCGVKSEFLITRGAEGMLLLADNLAQAIPAFNLAEVFDVSGAGDTVSACFALCLAAGLSSLEAAIISNTAASLVVRKAGTASTSIGEIRGQLGGLDYSFLH